MFTTTICWPTKDILAKKGYGVMNVIDNSVNRDNNMCADIPIFPPLQRVHVGASHVGTQNLDVCVQTQNVISYKI